MKPNQSPFGVHLKSAVLCVEAECRSHPEIGVRARIDKPEIG
jgi:hypothetical protein